MNSDEANNNNPLINEQELIDIICEIIKATRLFQVFNLHTVVLVKRKGDLKKLPSPPPEPTEAEIRANEHKITLESRQEMLSIEREIALHEIRVEREWARARNDIREREIELEMRRNADRIELEREKVRIQAQTATLTPILQIFAQFLNASNPNWVAKKRSTNCSNWELTHLLRSLCDDPDILTAEYRFGSHPSKNTKEKLTYRLVELWSVEKITGFKFEELPNSDMGLIVNINTKLGTKMAMFVFTLSGIDPRISKIYLRSSKGMTFTVPNLKLYRNLDLSEVIKRLEDKYGPKKELVEGSGKWI